MSTGVIIAIVVVVIIILATGGYYIYARSQDRPAQDPNAVDVLAQQLATDTTAQTATPGNSAPIVAVKPTATQIVSPPASQLASPAAAAIVNATSGSAAPAITPIPPAVVNTMPLTALYKQIDSAYAIVMSATTTPDAKRAAFAAVPPPGALDAAAKNAISSSSDPVAAKASFENTQNDIKAYKRKIVEMQAAVTSAQKTSAQPCGRTAAQIKAAGCVAISALPVNAKGGCVLGRTKLPCPSEANCPGGAICVNKPQIPAGKKLVDFFSNMALFK